MRKFFYCIALVFCLVTSSLEVSALTNPEPNPFANVEVGETTFTATVSATDGVILTVKDSANKEYSARFDSIMKYRDGAGPAAANEFALGDKVRVLIDKDGVIVAAQDAQLLLCNQSFSGYVRNPTATGFTIETLEGEKYQANIGSTTRYRDEDSKSLFGYTPHAGDTVRIHGVVNTNTKQIFTETFGAYISLLSAEATASLVTQVKEEAAAKIENEVKQLRANPEFGDVDSRQNFFDAIQFVKREGMVNGYKDGSFQPSNLINRAEFTKIIVNTKYASEVATNKLTEKCFPDVALDAWFAPFVCLAKSKGIIAGYPDGDFKPENPVNLAEAVTIISNTFGLEIPAAASGEAWYQRFLAKTSEMRITPLEFSDAAASLTRGQMAELIMRATQNSRGKLATYLEYLKTE
ncbi:MAG: S-layer homology domain-containing protein [Candidatus Gracilibacteria bacterium]|nr:S-layer homology domain-containing protein [Candidatus Gracilibacteria bacterium]MDD5178729.1 S-layer homology domain-containing protein [Candidatus Gracilibacteria bacterium]